MDRLDFCALDRHLVLIDHKVVMECADIAETDIVEGVAVRTEDVASLADDLGQIAKFRYGGATFAELCEQDMTDASLSAAMAAGPLGEVDVRSAETHFDLWPNAKEMIEAQRLATQISDSLQGALVALDNLQEEGNSLRLLPALCMLKDAVSLNSERANDIANLLDAHLAPTID